MENMHIPEFDFPEDKEKTPLLHITVSRNENDFYEMTQNLRFASTFSRISCIAGYVIILVFLINTALLALMVGDFRSVLFYGIYAAAAIVLMLLPRYISKREFTLAPNNGQSYTYSFFLHHFTFIGQYGAGSFSYDHAERAHEGVGGFSIILLDGTAHYIPKRDLSREDTKMLRAVLTNKLGSKFNAKSAF